MLQMYALHRSGHREGFSNETGNKPGKERRVYFWCFIKAWVLFLKAGGKPNMKEELTSDNAPGHFDGSTSLNH